MEERKKHKVMIGIEVVLLCMLVAILGTNAASSNPPSNGVSYGKNSQTTVEGALNDLYNKANYGNASEGQILKDKTALVGGKKVTGTMPDRRFTGNVTGGLNTSYPNIALNEGSRTQLTTGTNGVDYIATSPPQGWYEGGGSSYTVIPKSTVISLYGITADKIVKGQSIAGVAGTGETGYSSCSSCCSTCPTCLNTSDATATAADISSGKTAYVKGQKITGTGIQGKTYELKKEKATVSGQTFNYGTWTRLTQSGNGKTADFSVTLPFTPTKLIGCHLVLSGNYATSSSSRWDANFREGDESYKMNLASGTYASTSADSLSTYVDTETSCTLSGNKLNFHVYTFCSGSSACNCRFRTRADEFYLTGIIVYE